MRKISIAALLLLAGWSRTLPAQGPDPNAIDLKAPEVLLWPNGAPGSEGIDVKKHSEEWLPSTDGFHRVKNIHAPSVTVFLPPKEKATGVAFVICPGGGNNYLVMDLEGASVAKILNNWGVAAFILKSRLANTPGHNYKVEIHSLADAQRAIRLVRSRAQEWGVDRAHVGIMGFSAGGAIAALVETSPVPGGAAAAPIDRESSRPDFAVLGYPAGKPASLTYTKEIPPTFIVVNSDDPLAPISVEYYTAMRKAGVPVELHVYNRGGHGFGMTGRTPAFAQLPVSGWPARFHE